MDGLKEEPYMGMHISILIIIITVFENLIKRKIHNATHKRGIQDLSTLKSGLTNEDIGNKSDHLQLIIDILRACIWTCQIMRNMTVI